MWEHRKSIFNLQYLLCYENALKFAFTVYIWKNDKMKIFVKQTDSRWPNIDPNVAL